MKGAKPPQTPVDYRAALGVEKSVIRGPAMDSPWVQNHLGTGNHTEDLFVLNTHRQKPSSGTPDLVVTDQTGVIYDLVNETK